MLMQYERMSTTYILQYFRSLVHAAHSARRTGRTRASLTSAPRPHTQHVGSERERGRLCPRYLSIRAEEPGQGGSGHAESGYLRGVQLDLPQDRGALRPRARQEPGLVADEGGGESAPLIASGRKGASGAPHFFSMRTMTGSMTP